MRELVARFFPLIAGLLLGGLVCLAIFWRPAPTTRSCGEQLEEEKKRVEFVVGMSQFQRFGTVVPRDILGSGRVYAVRMLPTITLRLYVAGRPYGYGEIEQRAHGSVEVDSLSGPALDSLVTAEKDRIYCKWLEGRQEECAHQARQDSLDAGVKKFEGEYEPAVCK